MILLRVVPMPRWCQVCETGHLGVFLHGLHLTRLLNTSIMTRITVLVLPVSVSPYAWPGLMRGEMRREVGNEVPIHYNVNGVFMILRDRKKNIYVCGLSCLKTLF